MSLDVALIIRANGYECPDYCRDNNNDCKFVQCCDKDETGKWIVPKKVIDDYVKKHL